MSKRKVWNVAGKDKRYIIHPNEKSFLRERKPPNSSSTQGHVRKEAKFRKNQKSNKIDKNELEVKRCPQKKNQLHKEPKTNLPFCLCCKQFTQTGFERGSCRQKCDFF